MRTVMLIALVALASCERKTSEPNPAPTPIANDGVQMLTVGSEPGRLLRYHLIKGVTSPLELTMELDLDAGGRGGVMPALIMSLSIHVEDVLPSGAAKIKTTIEKARAEERPGSKIPVAAIANLADSLSGMQYTATLSPDGKLTDLQVVSSHAKTMANELVQVQQSFESLAMPMPAGPVGVGAKWSVRKATTQNGFTMTTVSTFEITAIDGDKVTFASTSTVSAPDQTVTQGGERATIKDIGGGGSSKGTVDLSKMTMVGETSNEFRGTMAAQGSAGSMRVAMKMTMK